MDSPYDQPDAIQNPLVGLLLGAPLVTPAPRSQSTTQSPAGITLPADPLAQAVPAPQSEYQSGHPQFEAARQSIKNIESSGGNYNATGPVQKDGDYAVGAYQVMKSNIPSWTKEVLGREMSEAEFRKDQSAQDRVFDAKFGQSWKQYGNPQDAASIWFSGQPLSGNKSGPDSNGTSVPGYISAFNGHYYGLGGKSGGGSNGASEVAVAENALDPKSEQTKPEEKKKKGLFDSVEPYQIKTPTLRSADVPMMANVDPNGPRYASRKRRG